MGCFSFLCKVTGEAALSTSFDGSPVHMFLLKKGKVIEYMHGNYDSYGRVFDGKGDSFEWKLDWGDVCDLMFDPDKSNGMAVILDPNWKKGDPYPVERSQDDPNQGWGEDSELLGDTSTGRYKKVEKPVHDFNFDF